MIDLIKMKLNNATMEIDAINTLLSNRKGEYNKPSIKWSFNKSLKDSGTEYIISEIEFYADSDIVFKHTTEIFISCCYEDDLAAVSLVSEFLSECIEMARKINECYYYTEGSNK